MGFSEDWQDLEAKCCKKDSLYCRTIRPTGPVDFILITRGWEGSEESIIDFANVIEDYIFHMAIRKYLCRGDQTYHLASLSKGGEIDFDRWYPLVEKELRLVAKPNKTRIIAVGVEAHKFLKPKGLCDDLQRVHSFGKMAIGAKKKEIEKYEKYKPGYFSTFCNKIDGDEFEEVVESVLTQAGKDQSYVDWMLDNAVNKSKLTMIGWQITLCYYSIVFRELRKRNDIILKLPRR